MSLKLMYITNKPEIAQIAERAGVDRIFVDMEYIGKKERQGGMDTVQSFHTVEDVSIIHKSISKAQLLVRCNPIHNETAAYKSSQFEIDSVVANGADIIMLPFFKTVREVQQFIGMVDKRVKTMLLLETPEAVEVLDEILKIDGIDEIHIGINDLSLGYGKKFMFELLADGTIERICKKIKAKNIPYGFGGIASIGNGALPSEMIIEEHYRLGSSIVILSRSFCNYEKNIDKQSVEKIFKKGVKDIRNLEKNCQNNIYDYKINKNRVKTIVERIVRTIGTCG